jgi:hypothetical protein
MCYRKSLLLMKSHCAHKFSTAIAKRLSHTLSDGEEKEIR